MAGSVPEAWGQAGQLGKGLLPWRGSELSNYLLWIIPCRAVILLLGINLAQPLGFLPSRLGPFPFIPFFNILSITLTLGYLAFWWNGRRLQCQLYAQIAVDLTITTVLVALTRGVESPFVSFYLLIVICCSLTLGRNGAVTGAALSTILFAGIAASDHLGVLDSGTAGMDFDNLSFRISLNALGFFSVAFLGTSLSQRLSAIQEELDEKIESLKRLRRLNENIVSSIRSGLITTNLQGDITLFNQTARELTESHRSESSRHIQSVIGKDLWLKIVATDFFRDMRPLRHELWIGMPSGERRFLGFSVSPLMDQERKAIGYILSFQDLTEIKNLEEEVRHKDRMAMIGRMAAGIAHEIRNPLTSMRGSVEILRSHVNLPAADDRLLDILMKESDRLNKFVEDLLYFARPGKGGLHSVDLAALLRDSVTLLSNSPEVRGKHVVRLDLAAEQIRILGNADRLKQVFWNLAQNALRAMPSGGMLTIRAGASKGNGVCIEFQDEGIGMTEEEREQLFQPFNSGFSRGTGLGLSIIAQIMEDHRGKIHFESQKGTGTRVALHFPSEQQYDRSGMSAKKHAFNTAC